jgi:proteasome lid subunit RPN8/RPN11
VAVATLVVPASCVEAMLAHARNTLPDECCGLLAGDDQVRFVYPLSNSDPSPTTYTIAPQEHFHAWRHATARGWDLIGAFHSHPHGPPHPSPTDVAMAGEPAWFYLIVHAGRVRAFLIDGGGHREIEIEIPQTAGRQ